MSDETNLQELAHQIRSKTLPLLDESEPSWLTWTPR